MQVACPHCQSHAQVTDHQSLTAVPCKQCGQSFDAASSTFHRPHQTGRIAHFDLIEQIGSGSFGKVWRARDTKLDRTVAVKVAMRGRVEGQEGVSFLREARAAAGLNHSGIVGIHEVGKEGEDYYLVSDFIDGVSLKDWLKTHEPTEREAARICADIADALAHAHQRGVIHRDLKPSNVMIDSKGQVYLMDFGLAKRETGDATLTLPGDLVGTPAYMSPEQAKGDGHVADNRSDIYSLGVILYRLLTGELPFRGHERMLLMQVLLDEPAKPRALNDLVSRDLEMICLTAMNKEPTRRYASASDFAADLRRFLNGEPVKARPVGVLARLMLWGRKPERVPESGILTMFFAVVFALWNAYGLMSLAVRALIGGRLPENPGTVAVQLVVITVIVCAPMVIVGLGIMARRLWALWSGAIMATASLTGWFLLLRSHIRMEIGGMLPQKLAMLELIYSYSLVNCAILLCAYLISIYSYYCNRTMMRWRRHVAPRKGPRLFPKGLVRRSLSGSDHQCPPAATNPIDQSTQVLAADPILEGSR